MKTRRKLVGSSITAAFAKLGLGVGVGFGSVVGLGIIIVGIIALTIAFFPKQAQSTMPAFIFNIFGGKSGRANDVLQDPYAEPLRDDRYFANMPMANMPMANMPMANMPMANMPMANMPMANMPMANMPMAQIPINVSSMMQMPINVSSMMQMPINVPTQQPMGLAEYRQVGILTRVSGDSDTILPLMGRPVLTHRDKWNFYTMNDKNNMIKLPMTFKGKSCSNEYGCDNIYNGDEVFVEGYQAAFKATVYENQVLRYI